MTSWKGLHPRDPGNPVPTTRILRVPIVLAGVFGTGVRAAFENAAEGDSARTEVRGYKNEMSVLSQVKYGRAR
jgi:hypothetical protein